MNNDAHIKLAVADGTFAAFECGLRSVGKLQVEIQVIPMQTLDQIARSTADVDGIIVGLQKFGEREILHLGPRVRAISRAGIGLDSIDLEAAKARGIAVIHQPDYATLEVATHAIALLMAVNRKLTIADAIARRGWKGRRALGQIAALDEMTVGIVGAGAIGKAVIARLLPLVDRVLYFDPYAQEVPTGAEPCETLDSLLQASNAISLHAPLNSETHYLIGTRELSLLPQAAILINVARGGLVDTSALLEALASNHLSGAGLDVFEQEPFSKEHPITQYDSVVLSPHVGFLSDRAISRLERQSFEDIVTFLVEGSVHGGRLAIAP